MGDGGLNTVDKIGLFIRYQPTVDIKKIILIVKNVNIN